MRIIYPYNEILPKRKAHDVFIVHECAALAKLGLDVTLLVGKGPLQEKIFEHYNICPTHGLKIKPLFIVRKNNPLRLSWNFPFFFLSQNIIQKWRPDWVISSVRKQAAYHFWKKVPGVRYLYEVHELSFYPQVPNPNNHDLFLEKRMLSQADLVTVTTAALKEILLKPPYALKVPIEVVPLAVKAARLPPAPAASKPLVLMYIGQLYAGQGLTHLLAAMTKVRNVQLIVVGGKAEEIAHFSKSAKELAISDSVKFLGFIPPGEIASLAQLAHAFVAPFENVGRMPFVAHTKLFEYAEWGRPIIAPDMPIVREHFSAGRGTLLFEPGNAASLAGCIMALHQDQLREKLQKEIDLLSGTFHWPNRAKIYERLLSA